MEKEKGENNGCFQIIDFDLLNGLLKNSTHWSYFQVF